MTHMTYTPGYQGYLRNFQRDHVSSLPPRLNGADNFEFESRGLMSDSKYATVYGEAFSASKLVDQHRWAADQNEKNARQAHQQSVQAGQDELNRTSPLRVGSAPLYRSTLLSSSPAPASPSSSSLSASPSPDSSRSLVPPAGRRSRPDAMSRSQGTTYSSTIGTGLEPPLAPSGTQHPRYPHAATVFANAGATQLLAPSGAATDRTTGVPGSFRSLASTLGSVARTDLLLGGAPNAHGSYERDYSRAAGAGNGLGGGVHPLQSGAGGWNTDGGNGAKVKYETVGAAAHAYASARGPTHAHMFPSPSLTGPTGRGAGLPPFERSGVPGCASDGLNASYQPDVYSIEGARQDVTARADDGVSGTASTRELFFGSTKGAAGGTVRIPGYAGFVPESRNNQVAMQLHPQSHAQNKDQLIATFKHDISGYTGYQPVCVTNIRGPRTPRGKKRMDEGQTASLILDSMKI